MRAARLARSLARRLFRAGCLWFWFWFCSRLSPQLVSARLSPRWLPIELQAGRLTSCTTAAGAKIQLAAAASRLSSSRPGRREGTQTRAQRLIIGPSKRRTGESEPKFGGREAEQVHQWRRASERAKWPSLFTSLRLSVCLLARSLAWAPTLAGRPAGDASIIAGAGLVKLAPGGQFAPNLAATPNRVTGWPRALRAEGGSIVLLHELCCCFVLELGSKFGGWFAAAAA